MRSRIVLAAFATLFAASGGILIACGGGDDSNLSATDSGSDSTVSTNDGGSLDSGSTQNQDGNASSAEAGNCTPISGPCDIVAQNCPKKGGQQQECVSTGKTGNQGTECVATQATESLPVGRACCPSDVSNPCDPGLECIGNNCSDGGPLTGRCSPHCCLNDNAACGSSDPEGIAGACDITITDGTNDLYYVCSYTEFCTPLGVKPCVSPDTACQVLDKNGTAQCEPYFGAATTVEHDPCGNGCADGLGCFDKQYPDGGVATFPDGGIQNECLYFCYVPATVTPFDAGVLTNQPGHGGCPGGENCTSITLDPSQFPAWLSVCGS